MNTKSVVLIIYGKINQQQKNTYIICKQLNGSVLKLLKPSFLGWNREKKKKISLAEPGPKFCISFLAGPGSGQNFNFSFGLGRARAKMFFFMSGRDRSHVDQARPGLENLARADL